MPIDAGRILTILRELEQTSPDALKNMDRELLFSIQQTLRQHRHDIDKILLRLAFVDEQRLN